MLRYLAGASAGDAVALTATSTQETLDI
jgi:hypothetical protein